MLLAQRGQRYYGKKKNQELLSCTRVNNGSTLWYCEMWHWNLKIQVRKHEVNCSGDYTTKNLKGVVMEEPFNHQGSAQVEKI